MDNPKKGKASAAGKGHGCGAPESTASRNQASTSSRALVPTGSHAVARGTPFDGKQLAFTKKGDMLVPEASQHYDITFPPPPENKVKVTLNINESSSSEVVIVQFDSYSMRVIKPAEKYDVTSFARAMNPDFAPRLKQLFDLETEAAVEAQKTGIYIGWRCPEFKYDCQRVNKKSRCFCDHLLEEHDKFTGKSVRVPCKVQGCPCKTYAWIPNRPEDIGEFWHQRRRDFDPTKWRAKCKCKHTHIFHDPVTRQCRTQGCGCSHFSSDFLCAACNRHYEEHETFFDTEDSRRQQGLPVGQDWLPFAEMPDLRNIALTGEETNDSRYLALTQGEGSIPQGSRPSGNDAVVNFGASSSRGGGGKGSSTGSGFRPVYD